MRYFIQIKTNPWDNAEGKTILELSGASEETLQLILSNYNGAGFIINVCKEVELSGAEGIETLDLSLRAYNCLKRAGINTVLDLIKKYNNGELYSVRNLGHKSSDEVINKLLFLNLITREGGR